MSRIALIGPLKQWGGLERLFISLANEFVKAGHDVEIVRIRGGDTPYPDELDPAVRVTTLATRGKAGAIPRVARWMRQERPDAVLTVKDHTAQVCVLARLLVRRPPRLVVVVSNMLSYVARRRTQRALIPRLYPRADRIVALSDGVAEDLRTTFGIDRSRVDVIYQPVVPDDLAMHLARPVEHPWFAKDADVPVLLGAGRLTPQKNFHLLISALARLRERRAARLVILGEGDERDSLRRHAHELGVTDAVDLYGAVPDPLPWMAACGAFVLSSRYEGFANVVAEALASGARVISTDCPSGPREILHDGRYGWLVPPGDAPALADAIEQALDADPPIVPPEVIDPFRTGTIARQYLRALGN